jgi:hypothetical protein
MKSAPQNSAGRALLVGDVLIAAILTLVGFASHNELGTAGGLLTTFLPLLVAWLLVAPFAGLYQPK